MARGHSFAYHDIDTKHPAHFAGNNAERVERQALGFNQDALEESGEVQT